MPGRGWRTLVWACGFACLLAWAVPDLAAEEATDPAPRSRADQLAAFAAAEGIEIKGLHKVSGPAPDLDAAGLEDADSDTRLAALLDGLGHVLVHGSDGRLRRIVILRHQASAKRQRSAALVDLAPPEDAAPFAFAGGPLASRIFTAGTRVRLSSGYGRRRDPFHGGVDFHEGVDYAARRGTEVRAIADGIVEEAGRRRGYGRFVLIRHDDLHQSLYAHLGRLAPGLRRGRAVGEGAVIARVGSSGRATGPHLHFELRVRGRAVDPLRYSIDGLKVAAR